MQSISSCLQATLRQTDMHWLYPDMEIGAAGISKHVYRLNRYHCRLQPGFFASGLIDIFTIRKRKMIRQARPLSTVNERKTANGRQSQQIHANGLGEANMIARSFAVNLL
jgi:hypothetical protein